MIKKCVIIGPESTGKSTLCKRLAEHYGTLWCPEYARDFLLKNGTDYTYADLLTIAKGQINLEDKTYAALAKLPITQQKKPIPFFIDTDMYVMKVWCDYVFEKCHAYIEEQIATRKYDLYLLCRPDLPWVKDDLREYPDLATREKLFTIYQSILQNQSTPWVEIYGDYDERVEMGVKAVEGVG